MKISLKLFYLFICKHKLTEFEWCEGKNVNATTSHKHKIRLKNSLFANIHILELFACLP